MALSPIDLQTLFAQVDKVGKMDNAQREGVAIAQALAQAQSQERTEARLREVNEAQGEGDGAEGINDRNAKKNQGGGGKKDGRHEDEKNDEKAESFIRDPDLGKNIDVSL